MTYRSASLPIDRRQTLAALGLGLMLPLLARPVRAAPAAALTPAAHSALVAFDGLYIPALFLSGSAGKSAEGPARATAVMTRLREQWPAHRRALEAVATSRVWRRALELAGHHITEADRHIAARQWPESHEALEHVREVLHEARATLGTDYALDRYTAFHAVMERIVGATTLQRAQMEADFSAARALWRQVERQPIDPAAFGLSDARQNQLRQAFAAETDALGRLSQALATGAPDDEVLKAAAAIKAPFIRAYTAFGWPPGEAPVLPG